MQSRSVDATAALYASEGLAFWGTFADHCRTSRDEVRGYFQRSLEVEALSCEIREAHWRRPGPDTALVTGWYVLRITPRGETVPTETRARFTFCFQRATEGAGPWHIVDHHSSLFPPVGY